MSRRTILFLSFFACAMISACSRLENSLRSDRAVSVAFSFSGKQSEYSIGILESLTKKFSDSKKYRFVFDDACMDSECQLRQVMSLVNKKIDFLLIDPVSENGWEDTLMRCGYLRVAVIFVGNGIHIDNENLFFSTISPDFFAEASAAVAWLEKELSARDHGNSRVNVCIVQSASDSQSDRERILEIERGIDRNPSWNFGMKIAVENSAEKTCDAVKNFVEGASGMNVIFTMNEEQAFGARKAILESHGGKSSGMLLVTFEATEKARDAGFDFSVQSDSDVADYVEDAILRILNSRSVEKKVVTKSVFF